MKIIFRCDSSYEIGTGHVIRCLHLAEILKGLGHEIHFVSQALSGNINAKIKAQGFAVQETDKDLEWITGQKPEWVVIDHYQIGQDWENALPAETKIFVIDDLMNRPHKCNVLLDQNFRIRGGIYGSLVPFGCRMLLGPSHALLNKDLVKAPLPRKISESPKILAFFGGTDGTGELLKLAQAMIGQKPKFHLNLVCLSSHQQLKSLQSLSLPTHMTLMVDPPNWIELLQTHDFYVGSGGTVTWERMFLGLPAGVIAAAPNQEGPNQQLGEAGFQYYWGRAKDFNYAKVVEKIEATLTHKKTLERISEKGLKLVHRFSPDLAREIFGAGVRRT